MGISLTMANIIVNEHLYKPLPKTVHTLGRQSITFDYEAAKSLCHTYGITSADHKVELEYKTRRGISSAEDGNPLIADTTFFGMLGVEQIHAVDHLSDEGADIIWDLNQPVPDELCETADFIIDGSTADNVFAPNVLLQNISKMLKPGGRAISTNVAGTYRWAYIMLSPIWFFDYYVINKFSDCKVYLFDHRQEATFAYTLRLQCNWEMAGNMEEGEVMSVVVVAEKSADSTANVSPSQACYRPAEEWELYRKNLDIIRSSSRPMLTFLTSKEPHYKQLNCYQFLGNTLVPSTPDLVSLPEAIDDASPSLSNLKMKPHDFFKLEAPLRIAYEKALDYLKSCWETKDIERGTVEILNQIEDFYEDAFLTAGFQSTERCDIDLSVLFFGCCWGKSQSNKLEQRWRWLGPQGRSCLFVALTPQHDYEIQIQIQTVDPKKTEILDALRIEINGWLATDQRIVRHEDMFSHRCVLPREKVLAHKGLLKIAYFLQGRDKIASKFETQPAIAFNRLSCQPCQ